MTAVIKNCCMCVCVSALVINGEMWISMGGY